MMSETGLSDVIVLCCGPNDLLYK